MSFPTNDPIFVEERDVVFFFGFSFQKQTLNSNSQSRQSSNKKKVQLSLDELFSVFSISLRAFRLFFHRAFSICTLYTIIVRIGPYFSIPHGHGAEDHHQQKQPSASSVGNRFASLHVHVPSQCFFFLSSLILCIIDYPIPPFSSFGSSFTAVVAYFSRSPSVAVREFAVCLFFHSANFEIFQKGKR